MDMTGCRGRQCIVGSRRPDLGTRSRSLRLFWVALVVLLVPALAQAQYFGRNKINYERFHFERMRTGQFDIYYYPSEEAAVRDAAVMLERWNYRLSRVFDHRLSRHQPVIIYANHADFQQTNVTPEIIGQGTGGFTEGMKNRIVLPLTGVASEDDHVLGHELVHVFQYEIADSLGSAGSMEQTPLWFIEGMAEYLSLGPDDPLTAMWLRDAALQNDIPTIDDITSNSKYFPYRYGQALWAYVTKTWGGGIIRDLFIAEISQGWDQACRTVLKTDPDSVSEGWQKEVAGTYGPRAEGLTPPDSVGRPVVVGNLDMNMGPALSPDGRYLALLSRRDVFTIDLYLADARTGRFITKLASSNSDAHFDALRFSESAGTWSPDGNQLAFVVFKDGNNRIAILDVAERKVVRDVAVAGVDAVQTLAWSPDGRRLAIGGTHGGFADIYLYDLETGEVTRLTEGPYAYIQPAWSPDGTSLAFATDRGAGTDFADFSHGPIRIGLIDLETGTMALLSMPGATKHIDPQFSPDGESLYLIADPDGISDIYRYSFEDSSFYRITEVATGISGLGRLSPAMSVAQETGDLVFSVFERGGYNIYGMAAPVGGTLWAANRAASDSTVTESPGTAPSDTVTAYLAEPRMGLPSAFRDTVSAYRPSLKLLYLEPASAGIAINRSGATVVGGTGFVFGDLLGDHLLGVTVTAGNSLDYIGGEAVYQNLKHRLDWGAALGHIPITAATTGYGVDTVEVDGEPTPADYIELVRDRIYVDQAVGFAEYPISANRRIELSTGYTRLTYHRERERVLAVDGRTIDEGLRSVPSPPALNLLHSSLAYVGDYSFFGIGSPARGKRFRVEAQPTFGSLTYLTASADYRHYFFLRPVTFAVRGLFIGRFLKDAEDSRLSQFFLGDEGLVRGYSLDSFNLSECTDSDDPSTCPELDRLIGSRIGVFNAEVRVPVFGPEGYGLVHLLFLPTELAAFFDAGVAWTRSEAPEFILRTESQQRIPVFSTGMAARFRVLGSLVLQVYYAYPFQRPEKGGHFRFLIGAGW